RKPATPPAGGSGGLEPVLRGNMERSFGADFSAVRLHSDAGAARTAGQYAAKAVTVGDNVYFGGGRYAPQSGEGRRLIAHELAHVVQQRRGGATAPRIDGSGGLEREAGRAADQAIGGGRAMVRLGSATGPAAEPEEEPWYKRAISKAKDVGSSVKDKATSFVQEVAKDPKVLIDHAEKLQPAVLLADATQKLADKAKGKPVLEGLTRNIASLAKANSNLVTKPAKAFGEKLVSKDKDGWHVHPLDATKAWKASADAGFKGVHAATFKAIDDFEDLEPAKPTVDEKAHPTLAALEQGSLAVSNATSKYSSQFVGGMGKALFSMVEGVGKMAIHPFDTVKGLGQLPGSSLTNPLKFIGTYAQLEEDLYDATFPDLEEEARQQAAYAEEARKQASEGQPPGKPPERMSYGAALRKFGGAMLPDQERDRKQTVGLVKALGENYIEAWEAKRYAELPGMALVDIGSFFIGGGAASAAGKGGKVAEAASATSKIGELAKTGEVAGSLGKAEELANAGGKLADVAKGTEAAKTAEMAKSTEVVDVGKGGAVGEVTEVASAGDGAKAGEVADATKAAEVHPPAVEAPKPTAEAPKPVEPAAEGIKAEPPSKAKVDPLEHAEPLPEGLKGEPVNDVKVDPLEHAEPLPEGLQGEAANNVRPEKDPKVSSLDEARQKKLDREAAQEAMPEQYLAPTGTAGPVIAGPHKPGGVPALVGGEGGVRVQGSAARGRRPQSPNLAPPPAHVEVRAGPRPPPAGRSRRMQAPVGQAAEVSDVAKNIAEAKEKFVFGDQPGQVSAEVGIHKDASATRKAQGVSGKVVQSAHVTPSSILRSLEDYLRRDAPTMLIDTLKHRAFDKNILGWFRNQRRLGRVEISVEELQHAMVDAIEKAPLTNGQKGALFDLFLEEVYQKHGLSPSDKLPLPYVKTPPLPLVERQALEAQLAAQRRTEALVNDAQAAATREKVTKAVADRKAALGDAASPKGLAEGEVQKELKPPESERDSIDLRELLDEEDRR
ncbi:DUF4157 domain-containing protein, partial [Mesorhizobium sp.]|uniref:eCIS core domain-containing protein n=1 Tax=Mesorhizobium sp. TaxID=1871066 RepID=UPI000FE51C2F